ncbi:MAG: MBL fold metallo-hydrolase [Gammaproteobacteria bacterium]
MQVASLGSGSKGNATIVKHDKTTILVDCGFSLRKFEQRLSRLEISPQEIDAILLTHEHSDHSSGVARLSAKFNIPVWSTVGTARTAFEDSFAYNEVCGGESTLIGCFEIVPVTVPHDAGEPVQYVFRHIDSGKKFGILTDAGHITSHIIKAYDNLHGLLLEFNYDQAMLDAGPYPYLIKQRVSGDLGHLSNEQSIDLLRQINTSSLTCLIAAHISENNNSVGIVEQQLNQLDTIPSPILASQETGFGWISI